ncbi:putative protein phosphatase 2C 7 [Paratrimastix pyriformis]|uniref:PPM-type phosphatase domain-containing protein n=1 Tax=Paratrimastix pyriformis TaxID=342808 RepID=A0ABQ8UMV2_9EUKA|nr:putative protein phosphatase 2C 7 [Paratrimastix pyriformis]
MGRTRVARNPSGRQGESPGGWPPRRGRRALSRRTCTWDKFKIGTAAGVQKIAKKARSEESEDPEELFFMQPKLRRGKTRSRINPQTEEDEEESEVGELTFSDADSLGGFDFPIEKVENLDGDGPRWLCYSTIGRRDSMEDGHVCSPLDLGTSGKGHVFGVFDGHGGDLYAKFAAQNFVDCLSRSFTEEDRSSTMGLGDVIDRLRAGMVEIHNRLVRRFRRKPDCGTTAVVALMSQGHLFLAHAGDSRAVICHDGEALFGTTDHKPESQAERARIGALGGSVLFAGVYRVNGILATARALGDGFLKPYVSHEPELSAHHIETLKRLALVLPVDTPKDFQIPPPVFPVPAPSPPAATAAESASALATTETDTAVPTPTDAAPATPQALARGATQITPSGEPAAPPPLPRTGTQIIDDDDSPQPAGEGGASLARTKTEVIDDDSQPAEETGPTSAASESATVTIRRRGTSSAVGPLRHNLRHPPTEAVVALSPEKPAVLPAPRKGRSRRAAAPDESPSSSSPSPPPVGHPVVGAAAAAAASVAVPTPLPASPSPASLCGPHAQPWSSTLILACDGVWDCFSNEDAARFIKDELVAAGGDIRTVASKMVTKSMSSDDNVTLVLIDLTSL